ncbi:hypothetical protein B7463_g7265, partial [Scytalidium lignicola]
MATTATNKQATVVHGSVKNFSCPRQKKNIISSTMVVWERLIRFLAADCRVLKGEPILPSPDFDLGTTTTETKLQAKVIVGKDIYDTTGATKVSDEIVTVKQLPGPLAQEDIPILRCVGLNYAKHIKEAGRTPPPFPFIFFEPNTCVADHNSNIVIPQDLPGQVHILRV